MVIPNSTNMKTYLIGGTGAIIFLLGTTFFFAWPTIFQTILYKKMQVDLGSETYRLWRDTPIPMYMSFYAFNWTNPEFVESEKPKLKEIGPYKFEVTERKTNITMNENGTITFTMTRYWHFIREESIGPLDDIITTLNPVALTAAYTVRDWSYFMKSPLGYSMKALNTKIYVQKKIGDILFYGYDEPLIDLAHTLKPFAQVNIPYDKFGWFYGRNGSDDFDGVFNMDTGENDIFRLGKLYTWNYKRHTEFYEGTCGMVNGTAGELFPPKQTKDKKLSFFCPDLCRSVELSFREEIEVNGIKAYKYVGDEYTFDNGTLDESNSCFCDGQCVPSGVLNVTSCRYGAPGYVSFPHFYLADDFYKNQVEGIEANPDKHTLFVALEPETGIPIQVAARFQINLLLAPYDFVGFLKNVPRIYFPMMWFEQQGQITKELALQVKLALWAPIIGQIVFAAMLLSGIAVLLYLIYNINKEEMEDETNKTIELKRYGISFIQNGTMAPLLEGKIDNYSHIF